MFTTPEAVTAVTVGWRKAVNLAGETPVVSYPTETNPQEKGKEPVTASPTSLLANPNVDSVTKEAELRRTLTALLRKRVIGCETDSCGTIRYYVTRIPLQPPGRSTRRKNRRAESELIVHRL